MTRKNRRRKPSGSVENPLRRLRVAFQNRPRISFTRSRNTRYSSEHEADLPIQSEPPSTGYLVTLLVVFALVVGAFIFHLHVRFDGMRLAREVRRENVVREELLRERAKLRLEIASQKSPGRIEVEARERLEMEVPDHDRIVPIRGRKRQRPASGRAI